jgi:hypothetical protein
MDPDDFDSGVAGGGRSMGAKIQRAMDRIAAGACRVFLAMRNYCHLLLYLLLPYIIIFIIATRQALFM